MTKVLTQRGVETAKPPKKGRLTKADGIVPGQRFVVHAGGKKSYRLIARINGKQENLEIGDAAVLTLAEAREKGKRLLGAIAKGDDPRAGARAETVTTVAEAYVERYAKIHTRRWAETERQINREIIPRWGKRPITGITKRDVNDLTDAIVDRGSPGAANGVFAVARAMFGWAIERGLLETSPFDRAKAPAPKASRDRTPNDAELSLIWQAAGQLGYPFGPIVRLLILTGARREEVAGMRWSELDTDRKTWTVPAGRVKNGVEHAIPLAPWARAIITELPHFAGSDLLFTTTGSTPVSGHSRAKRTLDAAITELNNGTPLRAWVIHDLRRGVASGMAKLGVALPVIERILNHISGPSFGGVQGVYQRHTFSDEMRAAAEVWAAHLLALDAATVPRASSVVALRR